MEGESRITKICPHCSRRQELPVATCDCGHTFSETTPHPRWRSNIRYGSNYSFSQFLMDFGMVVSVLGCVVAVGYALYFFFVGFANAVFDSLGATTSWLLNLLLIACGFLYNAAMFVVFSRVKDLLK